MSSKSSATIADVARKAGVSTATVSRLINGIGPISDDTRERVRDAIDELKYTPKRKRRARGAGMGIDRESAGTRPPLAFLRIGDQDNRDRSPVTEHLADALYRSAGAHGRTLSVHHLPNPVPSRDARDLIGEASGVLLRISHSTDITREIVEWLKGIPTVQVLGENRFSRLWVDHITPDNTQAGALAADYLIGAGCKRLVFAATRVFSGVAYERCVSFARVARDAGVDVLVVTKSAGGANEETNLKLSGLTSSCHFVDSQVELVQTIAAEASKSFGLFVPTDFELALLMPQMQMAGVKFGGKVHAIGCDFEARCLAALDPIPATMDLHMANIATRSIRRLLYRIEHPDEPLARISVAPTVVHPKDVLKARSDVEIPEQMSMVSSPQDL